MTTLTAQTDVGRLRKVLLMHARDAYMNDDAVEQQWRSLNYTDSPDRSCAVGHYDCFVEQLERLGIETLLLPSSAGMTLDAIYPRDASIVCCDGAILCNPGKETRKTEPAIHKAFLEKNGIPVLGAVTAPGLLEGGDVVWLGERTVAVGQGDRTNRQGIAQLRELLGNRVDDVISVPLPDYQATGDVFHLMSVLSPIDNDLALVYTPLMPETFRKELSGRGFTMVDVPESEFETLGPNVLALAPRVCLMLEGNPMTKELLEQAGAEVHTFDGSEICLKGCGGPTCLTRPLVRDA